MSDSKFIQGVSGLEAAQQVAQGALEAKNWDDDGIPLEDTNMAGVGGEEDRAVRKAAATTEAAWHGDGIGSQEGVWVWRIEKFQVVPWPKEKYGQFHEGDSYIILQSEFEKEETGAKSEKLEHDIHFWLGSKTSTDEKGTAAYKTVELDSFFDDAAVQHRETQGHESVEFRSYFKQMSYLPGGVESGFKVTQTDVFQNKLLQVRRDHTNTIIIEEEQITPTILNHRDGFILEKERLVYVFLGDSCSPFVKSAANLRAEGIESASNGEKTATHDIDDDFWATFGDDVKVTPADEVGEEVPPDFGEGVLYRCKVDDERKLTVDEVGRGDLKREMLESDNVMMVDTRDEIFLWLGKDCSTAEKASAFPTAVNYLKIAGRDINATAITILKEGHDNKNKTWKKMFG